MKIASEAKDLGVPTTAFCPFCFESQSTTELKHVKMLVEQLRGSTGSWTCKSVGS